MKFIVDVSTPDVDKNLVADLLEHELACHVEVADYEEPAKGPEPLKYDPPESLIHVYGRTYKEVHGQDQDRLLALNMILHVDGKEEAFRCGCGCNVFSHYEEPNGKDYYECHGCFTIYRGEKDNGHA